MKFHRHGIISPAKPISELKPLESRTTNAMKLRPPKTIYTIEELAERWNTELREILKLIVKNQLENDLDSIPEMRIKADEVSRFEKAHPEYFQQEEAAPTDTPPAWPWGDYVNDLYRGYRPEPVATATLATNATQRSERLPAELIESVTELRDREAINAAGSTGLPQPSGDSAPPTQCY